MCNYYVLYIYVCGLYLEKLIGSGGVKIVDCFKIDGHTFEKTED